MKWEKGKTEIYVGNKRIQECKLLIMNIPIKNTSEFGEVKSIDELVMSAEKKGLIENKKLPSIKPKEGFWAHISTIQAWAESGYDTNLLDVRLAFPILKELAKAGDPIARKKFKDEIFRRFSSGYLPVAQYLIEEGYLEFLTEEELDTLFEVADFSHYINDDDEKGELERAPQNLINIMTSKQIYAFLSHLNPSHIQALDLSNKGFKEFPKPLFHLKNLEYLDLSKNRISKIPEKVYKLARLKELILANNFLRQLPNTLGKIHLLTYLTLANNKLKNIPPSICQLTNLKALSFGFFGSQKQLKEKNNIRANFLKNLPSNFKNLKNLEGLDLGSNDFSSIPSEIYHLNSLKYLNMSNNHLKEIPCYIKRMKNLRKLELSINTLRLLPESLGNLENLRAMFLDINNIENLPFSIGHLKQLKKLSLSNNNLEEIPDVIAKLSKLELLNLGANPLQEVPIGIFKIPNLKYLYLPSDKIKPPDFFVEKYKKRIISKNEIRYSLIK